MARILVTGASGFIGSALANKLHDLGHEIIVSGSRSERKCKHDYFLPPNCAGLSKLKTLDYCFHQAAHNDTTDTDEKYMYSINCDFSLEVFNQVANMGCKKIIYASSASVYGLLPPPHREDGETCPANIYSQSKNKLENVANKFSEDKKIPVIGLRYFNVYGIGEQHKQKRASMIYKLCKQAIQHGKVSIFKSGEQTRDWVAVEDIVDLNIACLEYDKSDIFNAGTGVGTSINDVISTIKENLGEPLEVEYLDNPFTLFFQNHTKAHIGKTQELLNYKPKVDIKTGVKNLLEKMKKASSL